MPFILNKKRKICSSISLILSAGILTLQPAEHALGQTNFYNCRPNTAGDGWVCETLEPSPEEVQSANGRFIGSDRDLFEDDESTTQDSSPSASINRPVSNRLRSSSELDWVDRDLLTPEQLALVPDNCCGAYIEPVRPGVDNNADPATADTQFQTQAGFNRLPDGTTNIDGPVYVQQGNRTITNTDQTTINDETDTILMQGNVEFREPGVLIRGSSAFIDQVANNNRLENGQYVLHDYGIHGSAESIVYSSNTNFLTIINGEFSRCEPEANFWKLSANSILLDQELNRGYAQGTTLRIADVPVFYYPFTLTFPLGDERISGFLAPSAGSTRDGGVDFELPYYFNIAPHFDATVSPRLISDRGVMINAETRYLASWSMNTVNLSHLAGDKKFELDATGLPAIDSPPQEDRWFIGYEHEGALGNNWTTFVDYNAVSDDEFFEDLGSSGLNVASRTHLNRQGRLNYRSSLFQGGLNVQRIEIIDPFLTGAFSEVNLNKPFDRLPQFSFSTDLPIFAGLRFGLEGEFTSFDRDLNENRLSQTSIENGALVNGERLNLEPSISWDLGSQGWFVRPTAKFMHTSYELEHQANVTEQDPDLGVTVFSLDSGLIFDRDANFGGGGYTQTLEPRLFYLKSDYEDQSALPLFDTSEYNFSFNQLFRDNRFSGGDRIADADQLTATVTSRLLDPQGKERARFSLGQIFYFDDRLVDLNNPLQSWTPRNSPTSDTSAYVGELSYAFSDNWRISTDIQWDEDLQEIDEGNLQFHFQSDNNFILNVAYRYRPILSRPLFPIDPLIDRRIKQTDLSTVVPVNSNWRVLGRWNYDHSNSRNLEAFAGVEFSNCCTTIRLIAREWVRQEEIFRPQLESNRGIFFQFTLNGLGNISGGGLSNLLNDSIIGFKEPY